MARKQTLDAIIQLYKKLGGNTSEVLGTKTNVNFLGKGKSPELMLDMDINPEALGVLPQSKAVEELTNSVGYAVSGKLNDIQANQLLKNMQTMESVYFPTIPENVTDLATRTSGLDKAGLMSLRQGGDPTKYKPGDPITSENFAATGFAPSDEVLENLKKAREMDDLESLKPEPLRPPKEPLDLEKAGVNMPIRGNVEVPDDIKQIVDELDLPPPGSRGGPDDIAAPFSGAGLEAIKNVKGSNLIVDDIVNKIYLNAGVSDAAQPVVRANAREFLNRVKDLEDPEFPGGPTLSSLMEADDFRFMTEGGGGGMGDPFLLVQKYFGPKVASAVARLDGPNDIQLFAERLVSVRDGRGRTITDRGFDPESVDIEDFEFADGGRVPAADSQLVKESDEVLGYRGDAAYRSGSEQASSIGQGNVGTQSDFGDGPPQGGGDGDGGGGGNQKLYTPPVKVSIGPDYTPLGPVPRFADLGLNTKYGIINLRTDLFDTLKDQELDSELSFTGNVGPVDINARTDLEGNKSLGLGFRKGNFSGGAFTDFDGIKNIGFNYSKTFADGGLARPGYVRGKLVGKALGLFKRKQALERGAGEGFAAVEQYGITGKDITRMFKELAVDPSLQGKEKTEYFKVLNQALKNPEEFPDTIKEIQMKLGIEIGTGFRNGGLAGILEV